VSAIRTHINTKHLLCQKINDIKIQQLMKCCS